MNSTRSVIFGIISIILFQLSLLSATFAQSSNVEIPFQLIIVGSSAYVDVQAMVRSLNKSPKINEVIPSRSTQGVVEWMGRFKGSNPGALKSEIESAAVDRFQIESFVERDGIWFVTLRSQK
ncbi:MAG: hypothetical protein HY540_00545 [Deltaproteobacteria bacterium]|nr:hypothetical protein [Deltaproteobacteria bacterium]